MIISDKKNTKYGNISHITTQSEFDNNSPIQITRVI